METLKECATAFGSWAYTILSVKIPLLNTSIWLLLLSLFALRMLLKVTDVVGHRSQSTGQDQNNNKVYREE